MLSQEDKNALTDLKRSQGWAVLKRLEEEYVAEFNRSIMQDESFDINNPETQKKIQEASMYIRARKGVFDLVNNNSLGVARPKV